MRYARVNKSRLRLSVLLTLLVMCSILLVCRLLYLEQTTYAFTISLGHGAGFTVYTYHYRDLPPVLQESVRVHEGVHLEDGTVFINENKAEIAAYTRELQFIDEKIRLCREKYRTTHDIKYKLDLDQLIWFRTETRENMELYLK